MAHSTDIKGFSPVYGGDDRWYNNIFIGDDGIKEVGTDHYNGYTTSLDEYISNVHDDKGSDHGAFNVVEQPVYINQNAYMNGANPFDREEDNLVSKDDPKIKIVEEGNEVFLEINLPDNFEELKGDIHSTHTLERVRLTDVDFESPDGSDVVLNLDLLRNMKEAPTVLGPSL
ncbi:MAG: hypothetical protein U5K84_05295 [Alkalibacterium sp.]|nr:hypothetical protein [Alkalibacterium sp.]